MLQAASTDFFNPLVPKGQNSEYQNLLVPLQINPIKIKLKLTGGFLVFAPFGNNGLI